MRIYVEGIADEVLIRQLGFPKKRVFNEKNRGNVCKRLSKSEGHLGLVDEDPQQNNEPSYLKSLQLKSKTTYFKVFEDRKNGNRIIMLRPDMEGWLLKLAKDEKIDLQKEFSLPSAVKELHKVIHLNSRLEDYIQELLRRENKPILKLKSLISEHF